jgi:nucleotide-binding universal stress UspA family protein
MIGSTVERTTETFMTAPSSHRAGGTNPQRTPSQPVVVGYLDSPAGDAALRAAAREAKRRGASVTILHQLVGADAPDRYGPDATSPAKDQAAMLHLLRLAQDVAPGLEHLDVKVVRTPIAQDLVLASKAASLLVLGVTTTHAASAMLFDTVPRAVLKRACCPVMVVPPNEPQGGSDQVVCAIDRSADSVDALQWAATEASLRGVVLLAVEVVESARRRTADDRQSLDDWVRTNLPSAETPVVCSSLHGPVARALLEFATENHATLVIGAHRMRSWHEHSVSRIVTAQTIVPVVALPANSAEFGSSPRVC